MRHWMRPAIRAHPRKPHAQAVPVAAQRLAGRSVCGYDPGQEEGTLSPNVLVKREVRCPLCGKGFRHWSPRSGTYSLIRRDSDFCPHYRGTNPTLYQIYVCPGCNFAAYRDDFVALEERSHQAVLTALGQVRLGAAVDFTQPERSLFAALRSFELALISARGRGSPLEIQASLLHRAAWICRYGDELGREVGYLSRARDLYQAAFDRGVAKERNTSDLTVAYLVGELMLRTGKIPEAQPYFLLVANASDSKPTLLRSAKDRLYDSKQAAQIQRLLEATKLFHPIAHLLGLIAAHSERRSVPPGGTLFRKGEPGLSMFVVAAGEAEVYLDDPVGCEPVAVVGPGETLGEMSLFLGMPRSATILAPPARNGFVAAALEVIEIPRTAFRNLLKLDAAVVAAIAETIARRQRENAHWLEQLEVAADDHGQQEIARPVSQDAGSVQSLILPKVRRFFGFGAEPAAGEAAGGCGLDGAGPLSLAPGAAAEQP